MFRLILGFLTFALVVAVVVLAIRATARATRERKAAQERRRRYVVDQSGPRLPMAATKAPAAPTSTEISDAFVFTRTSDGSGSTILPSPAVGASAAPAEAQPPASPGRGVTGRIVNTPDGEMILTTPPFALKSQMVTRRLGRYLNALSRRLPAWVIVCPKVRLDTLLTPTRPDGRDPRDWREWRRRVRVRAIDLVLCDRRTWRPLGALMFDHPHPSQATTVAGGVDRMIEEVLRNAGLPALRLSGDFEADWPLIAPLVDEAILRGVSDEELIDAGERVNRVDPPAAVSLLRMDEDKGWVLE